MKIQLFGGLPAFTEFLKSAWRPVVGGNLVGWYIFASFTNPAASEALKELALVAMTFYFVERAVEKARNGSPTPPRNESETDAS